MDCLQLIMKVIDGKYRKIGNSKIKNAKHLKKVAHNDELITNLKSFTDTELNKKLKQIIGEINV